ncbi:hypothetical protein D3C75_903330 [compost metagenome]
MEISYGNEHSIVKTARDIFRYGVGKPNELDVQLHIDIVIALPRNLARVKLVIFPSAPADEFAFCKKRCPLHFSFVHKIHHRYVLKNNNGCFEKKL